MYTARCCAFVIKSVVLEMIVKVILNFFYIFYGVILIKYNLDYDILLKSDKRFFSLND